MGERRHLAHQTLKDLKGCLTATGFDVEVVEIHDEFARTYHVYFVFDVSPPAAALQFICTFADTLAALMSPSMLVEVLPYVRGHREEAEAVLRLGGLDALRMYFKKETP